MAEEPSSHNTVPFGEWLLQQRNRTGWVDELIKSAKAAPKFPKKGTPDDVRKRLRDVMAEGDMFEAVDDAESDWLSC